MATPPLEPRRTFSAPSISIEDTTAEEPLEELHSDDPASPDVKALPKRNTAPPPQPNGHFHHRRRSPGPEWNTPWDPSDWKDGRVLVIDYLGRDDGDGKRRIQAQEIRSVKGLRTLLENRELRAASILRVIHIQNASWANHYILRKFNMEHDDDMVGSAFGRWARFEKPQQRAGKPVLNARTFRPQRDPWRGISRCAFGLDYLKHYDARKYNKDAEDEKVKMMELNTYDPFETPVYGYDVFVQRLSVYVQHREPVEELQDFEAQMRNPYNQDEYNEYRRLKKQYEAKNSHHHRNPHHDSPGGYFPHLDELDNGNTIIVFENAQSSSPEDTLIQARHETEARWRRLPFYVRKEQKATDEQLAVECMDLVLKDIFKAITVAWDRFLRACETHVGILEDKIYENPADESRAPELWINSSLWLKVEKLVYLHLDLAKDVRNMMAEVTGDDGPDEWISQSAEEFDKLANSVNEDLIKPTGNLSDMMYKSVEIRDSRLGLQLDASMWRLSWITFIFLPLTFISGFFGMNVDIFSKDENNPKLKWYFIVTVPLMVTVVLFWFFFKRAGPGLDNDPTDSQRGVYEHLFHEFSDNYPRVWAREGPRMTATAPNGSVFKRLKWRLIRRWFDPDKTIKARGYNPAEDLGLYARFKRKMTRRWLRELENDEREQAAVDGDHTALEQLTPRGGNSGNTSAYDLGPAMEAGSAPATGSEGPLVDARSRSSSSPKLRATEELAYLATQVAAEGEPGAVPGIRRMRSESGSPAHGRSGSGGRPGSSGLSAAMVEVEMSDVGGSGDDGEAQDSGEGWRRGRSTGGKVDRLHVGFKPGRGM
ncbi:putative mg2+ transporter family protein [Neofusicoccum parvum]|uniref:Mg2+ transporter family protein n=1 Tax=Neofusicoccum parvum TaxID=310453 RepID=A0ACB5SAX3_9PEZI|nr:putative mg2+ transporter family protein [Neofusicoccum parvum]